MKAPCKNCPDRAIGCHAHCEKYIAFRKAADEVRLRRGWEGMQQDYFGSLSLSKKKRKRRR